MKYSEMKAALVSRANEIQTALFDLDSDIHNLSGVLSREQSTINHVSTHKMIDGAYREHEYFDFSIEYHGYGDCDSDSFNIKLPCDLVEEWNYEQIKQWFIEYFEKENIKDRHRQIKCELNMIQNLLRGDYVEHVHDIVDAMQTDTYDEYVESYIKKHGNKLE